MAVKSIHFNQVRSPYRGQPSEYGSCITGMISCTRLTLKIVAAIVSPKRNIGPTVVRSFLNQIQLIAAFRAMLSRPQRAARCPDQAFRIAVPETDYSGAFRVDVDLN